MRTVTDKARKTLNSLREKPRHVRERIATAGAASITAIVALVWVTAFIAERPFALDKGGALPAAETAQVSDALAAVGASLTELQNAASGYSESEAGLRAEEAARSEGPARLEVVGGTEVVPAEEEVTEYSL